jgi:hypothetical protein
VLAIFWLQATLASMAIACIAFGVRAGGRARAEARLRSEGARAPEAEGNALIAGRIEAQGSAAAGATVVEVDSRIEAVALAANPITGGVIRTGGARFALRAREVRLAPFSVALDDGRRVAVRGDTDLTLLAPIAWKKTAGGWVGVSTLRAGERALVRGIAQRAAGDGNYREVIDAFEIGAGPEQRLVIESNALASAIARENAPGMLAPALTLLGLALVALVDTREPPVPSVRRFPDPATRLGTVLDTGRFGASVDIGHGKLVYLRSEAAAGYHVGDQVLVTCDVPFCGIHVAPAEPPSPPDPRIREGAGAAGCFVLALVALAVRGKRRLAAAERRLATF